MSKLRGFEVVADKHRTAFSVLTDEKKNKITIPIEIKLPTRASAKSAGYDFYIPKDVQVLPGKKTIIWSDVKAFMQPDEVLQIYIRSSKGIKEGLMIPNNVGIIDSDYYSNEGNDGNIAIALVNTSGVAVNLKAGDRIAQGIFIKFLTTDETVDTVRKGGIGSSDE